jgi:hypothetical protein
MTSRTYRSSSGLVRCGKTTGTVLGRTVRLARRMAGRKPKRRFGVRHVAYPVVAAALGYVLAREL